MLAAKPFLGSLIADALALPGHWYYDRAALVRDYGSLDSYQSPRNPCLLYTSPSPRDRTRSRMPSSA
mgnify:CR=1 FL=1